MNNASVLAVLAVTLLPLASACASKPMTSIEIQHLRDEPIDLWAVGSVEDVIHGRAPSADDWIDVSAFAAGFEAGSPEGLESIGELIAFNGLAYARSTAAGGGLLVGDRVLTNGAVFLSEGVEPSWRATIDGEATLASVYAAIHDVAQGPFLVVGVLHFRQARVTAITCAPIHGENLFEHTDKYYARGNWTHEDLDLALVGCAADLPRVADPDLLHGLGAVLYQNPSAMDAPLTAHTHALSARGPIANVRGIGPQQAKEVMHLFDDSTVLRGHLDVYPIGRTKAIRAD